MRHSNRYYQIEEYVKIAIPWLVLLLLIMVILDFTDNLNEKWENILKYVDMFIIVIFLIDLYFKAHRVKTWKEFMYKYWLDLIAVIPFGLLLYAISKTGETIIGIQKILHIETETQRIIEEVETINKIKRGSKLTKITKIFRLPRLIRLKDWFKK